MGVRPPLPFSPSVPPLTPDGDQARRWAEDELARHVYQQAQPTVVDRVARAVQEFFQRLFGGHLEGGWGVWVAVGVVALVIVLIVIALVISARPRGGSRHRAGRDILFGDVEDRTAAQLRRAAAEAEGTDLTLAVILRFRALAKGLIERRIIEVDPGATVHAFAREAGRAFPAHAQTMDAAADAFDQVRYLDVPGDRELYRAVAAADDALRSASAVRDEPAAAEVR